MFIAEAAYDSKQFGFTHLKICSDMETEQQYEEQNTDSLIHLCYERELPDTIMKIAATRELPVSFNFRGDVCKLTSYTCDSEERFYNKYRKNYVVERVKLEMAAEIITYKGRCSCPSCYAKYGFDGIENICGAVGLWADPHETVEIDLQRCNRCRKYFIDNQSLKIYEKRYGRLRINRCTMDEYMRRHSNQNDGYYAPDSILSRNGYYADLRTEDRQRVLSFMMENGISKAEIKNKLTEFIEYRGERCYKAVDVWRADLKFVNEYMLEKEKKITFH